MTRAREPGYTPFSGAPPFQDEEPPLPINFPAEERQRLTQNDDEEAAAQAAAKGTILHTLLQFVWQGGSPGDAWLHMTAAQVCSAAPAVQAQSDHQPD